MLLVLFAALYSLTISGPSVSVDVVHGEVSAWRIANTGSPWLEDVDISSINQPATQFATVAANGHLVSNRTPGAVVAGVPAYLVDRAVRGPGSDLDDFSVVPGNLTAALLTSFTVMLIFLALAPRTGTSVAAVGSVALGLTTPVWTIAADGLWPHTVTVLACAGMAYGCARNRWLLVGVFGGIGLWGRLHLVLVVIVLGVGLSLLRRDARPMVHIGAVSGLFMGLSVVWTHWMYSTWNPAGGYGNHLSSSVDSAQDGGLVGVVVNQAALWIAPDRGIVVWTPVLLVLAPSLVSAWRRDHLPDWSRLLLVGAVVYTVAQGLLNVFHGGDDFYGQRLGLELLVCAAPAFTIAAQRASRTTKRFAIVVVWVQGLAMVLGALSNHFYLPSSDAWRHNAFVTAVLTEPVILVFLVAAVAAGLVTSRRLADPERATAIDQPALS